MGEVVLVRDRSRLEQIRQIDGINGIAQKWAHAEDFLHGAQIGRMAGRRCLWQICGDARLFTA